MMYEFVDGEMKILSVQQYKSYDFKSYIKIQLAADVGKPQFEEVWQEKSTVKHNGT